MKERDCVSKCLTGTGHVIMGALVSGVDMHLSFSQLSPH